MFVVTYITPYCNMILEIQNFVLEYENHFV